MSDVVIGNILPYTQAIATNGQTVFGTNWTANVESDVVVYLTPSGAGPNDATQILSYPSQYSVAFIGGSQQVQVTLVVAANAGDRVTIIRNTPADRVNLYSNTNFTPTMLNNDFGILTLVDQQAELVDQKIGPRYNYSAIITNIVDTILPVLGANETWVKNPANTAIIPYSLPQNGIAPANMTYVTLTDETANLPNSFNLNLLGAGLLVNNPAGNNLISTAILGTSNQISVVNGNGLGGSIGISIVSNPIIPGTSGMGIPIGTTAQRVTPLSNIGLRFNTDTGMIEYFAAGIWNSVQSDSALLTLLASHTVGQGASLIGLQNQSNVTNKTVQDLANAPFLLESANGSVQNGYVLTAGSGVTLTPGVGVLTISSTGGTVVSISEGSGIICTPNPITGSGSVALNTAAMPAFTMTGAIDMGSHLINNVTDPVSAQDAMTLHYAGITYLALAGGTMAGNINLNNLYKVINAVDPTNPQDYATKNYVDLTALNGTSVYAATISNLNVTQAGAGAGATLTDASGTFAAFSVDSVSPPLNSNVLVKNLAIGNQHLGVYTLTRNGDGISIPYQLTRATSYDTPVEINNTGLIIIDNGTQQGQAWYNSANIVTVDTTAFVYSKFGTMGTVTSVATAGLATGGPITASGTVTVTAALQTDEQTGTSNTVATTPGVQHFHPSAAKAWVNTFGGTIQTSYNVTSITHVATGQYTVNFTNAFANGNYTGIGVIGNGLGFCRVEQGSAAGNTTTAARVYTYNSAGTAADEDFGVVFFGTLA